MRVTPDGKGARQQFNDLPLVPNGRRPVIGDHVTFRTPLAAAAQHRNIQTVAHSLTGNHAHHDSDTLPRNSPDLQDSSMRDSIEKSAASPVTRYFLLPINNFRPDCDPPVVSR